MDLIIINGNHIEDSYSLTQLLHCKNHLKATILPGKHWKWAHSTSLDRKSNLWGRYKGFYSTHSLSTFCGGKSLIFPGAAALHFLTLFWLLFWSFTFKSCVTLTYFSGELSSLSSEYPVDVSLWGDTLSFFTLSEMLLLLCSADFGFFLSWPFSLSCFSSWTLDFTHKFQLRKWKAFIIFCPSDLRFPPRTAL